jgi:transposase-like protein
MGEIAERLQRGVDAVASHCQGLLPPGVRVPRRDAELVLRAELEANPHYDWRAGLRAAAEERGTFYWDHKAEEVLRAGWRDRIPMAELVKTTKASEIEIARHLVALRLANNVVQVAERLGCAPDSTLDVRVRMATDRAAAAVWVLVVDGARSGERAKELDRDNTPKVYRHVSVHASADLAEQHLVQLLIAHRNRGGTPEEVTVTLAQRTVGDLAVGPTHHEQAPTLHALDPIPSSGPG